MMHKAWCSIEEVPYCFPRPSIKFQGHKGQKIDDLDQIWARLLGRSQLSNPSDLPCLNLQTTFSTEDFDIWKDVLKIKFVLNGAVDKVITELFTQKIYFVKHLRISLEQ